MAKVIEYSIGVSTEGAVKSIGSLETELEKLQAQFKSLEIGSEEFTKVGNKIREVQSEIKTLDERFEGLGVEQKAAGIVDSFNVLAGSVGAVTGTLVALGVESKALEGVEKRLLGLITVVSSLREVSNGLANAQKTLIPLFGKVGNAIKAAFASNPIGVITVAVIALGAAIAALVLSQDDEKESLEKLAKAREEYQKQLVAEEEQTVKLLQVRGATQVQIAEEEVKIAKRRAEEAASEFARQQSISKFSEESTKAREANLQATRNLELAEANLIKVQADAAKAESETRKKLAEERKKEADDKKKAQEDYFKAEFDFYIRLLQISKDVRDRQSKLLKDTIAKDIEEIKVANDKATGVQRATTIKSINDIDEYSKSQLEVLGDYINVSSEFLKQAVNSTAFQTTKDIAGAAGDIFANFAAAQDQTTKEGFEQSKKFKVAEVVTTSTQAAFEAFAGAQKFNAVVPGLGTIIGAALVASIIAASRQSIAQIKSSKFESSNAPSGPSGGVSAPISVGGLTQQNVGFGGITPTAPTTGPAEPIRAYVVSNDVSNGLQANANINRRRRIGPG
jgi:hypothetical protein